MFWWWRGGSVSVICTISGAIRAITSISGVIGAVSSVSWTVTGGGWSVRGEGR